MKDTNKSITLSGESALEALAELEFMLISLHKIGSHYMDKPVEKYNAATTSFIDNSHITHRLAKIRSILSEPFDTSLGHDDMDDIERRVCQIELWKPEQDI